MQKFFRVDLFLCLILVIASTLRLWQLGSIPSGVLPDEVGIGYIAYSFLKTGVSPYGDRNYLAIQEAWGGSRPPLYIYSVIPSVAAFGLTPFAIRLPSAVYGILSVLIFFLLLKHLSGSRGIARMGAFLMAINPWAIQMSRQALLESIALFFILTGVYAFVKAGTRWVGYALAAVCFIASLFSYDAPKIFLPPFLGMLVVLYWKILRKAVVLGAIFVGVMIAGYMFMLQTTYVQLQVKDFNAVSLVKWPEVVEQVDAERTHTNAPLWLSSIVHNKGTVVFKKVLTSYSHVFSLNWLFINGQGNLQHSVGDVGQYLLFELPFFFIGLALVITKPGTYSRLWLWWMLIGALPGALTSTNNPLRAVLMLPAPLALSAFGFDAGMQFLKKQRHGIRVATIGVVSVVACMFIARYLFVYFFDYPVYASEWWSKQQNEAVQLARNSQTRYPHVFVSGRWEAMYAFFAKTDPTVFRTAYTKQGTYNGVPVMQLENVTFGWFDAVLSKHRAPETFFPKGSLFIYEGEVHEWGKPVAEFYDPFGVRVVYRAIKIP